MENEFYSAVEDARRIEKKALSYSAYGGSIEISRDIDLNPKDYADYDYTTMVNLYQRTEKIIKASGIRLYGPAPKLDKKAAAKTQEIESKVKEITGEALKGAREISEGLKKKPIETKPPATEEPAEKPEEIEFEALGEIPEPEEKHEEKELELEALEPEIHKELEIEEEKEREPEKIEPLEPALEEEKEEKPERIAEEARPQEKEKPAPAGPAFVPPQIRERAEQAGSRKYDEIEERIMATLGEKADEASLKKKMLELTKGLFKEKSMQRREQITTEITVLKNMLRKRMQEPRKTITDKDARSRLLETIVSTQKTELASTKDKVLTEYRHQVEKLKMDFMDNLAQVPEEEEKKRKAAYEKFVFDLTSLSEKLPGVIEKYLSYASEKHMTELEKLESSLGKGEKGVAKDAKKRRAEIRTMYKKEFDSAKNIIRKNIDAAIESGSHAVFKEEKPQKEEDIQAIVEKISNLDDGTLLYFLHGADPDFYKRYERKHLSKQEAIFKAKELMAREKGLSEDMVSKYFSDTEG